MVLFIFLASISIIFSLLLYDCIKSRRQIKKLLAEKITVDKLKQSAQQLQEKIELLQDELSQSTNDSVTHLAGWRVFEDRLNQSIKEGERYQLVMALLLVDIDDFKIINDALGADIGDLLLQEVARRLKSCIRQVDSVTRFTKDTFAILLPQLSKAETAALVAQRILRVFEQVFQIKEHELYVTVGIGIAIYPVDGKQAADLLKNAGQALQLAKDKGKQNYQFYREGLHLNSHRELILSTSLRRDTVVNEFVVYYQPIMNVSNQTIFCMEALPYWQQAEWGLIDQQELFHYAEKQNSLNKLSEWLLQVACQQFLRWQKLDFSPQYLGISLSIKQLENSHFIYNLSQILQKLAFKPEWLLLEIRASHSSISFDVLEKTFNMLKYLGIQLVIDDFGSEAFPLYHLRNFAVNYLKLDHRLIENIETNSQAVALVKSMILLAQHMSMQLIAQNVESKQQLTALQTLGCVLMQGPFFGVPRLANEIEINTSMLS